MPVRVRLLATTIFSSVASASFLVPQMATAADIYTKASPFAPNLASLAPAVDGVNSKFGGFGGTLGNRSLYEAQGSLTIPLADRWGFQLDGAAGSFDHR